MVSLPIDIVLLLSLGLVLLAQTELFDRSMSVKGLVKHQCSTCNPAK